MPPYVTEIRDKSTITHGTERRRDLEPAAGKTTTGESAAFRMTVQTRRPPGHALEHAALRAPPAARLRCARGAVTVNDQDRSTGAAVGAGPAGLADGAAPTAAPARWQVIGAFAIIYVIWGSTYLAIRFAIETLPPFLMAGARFLIAGGVLYAWMRVLGGAARPARADWKRTAIVGVLLLLGGNGLVVWSEFRIPSGVAALLVGIEPCWVVLFDWLRPGGQRPTGRVVLGLALGVAGMLLLVGPDTLLGGGRADVLGVAAVLIACLSWAAGSVYSRYASMPASPFMSTAMQMLAGGAALVVVATALGEPWRVDFAAFSVRSSLAWLYLIVFGSLVTYTAYVWLLRVSSPARVSTYAYVNPLVAVFLGWLLAGEALTLRMMVAAAVIVSGVVLMTLAPKAQRA
jgi:drug/metabolite transporter (DMT)-like permease